ncbi:MAG: TrmH family RNA methyltransferase [Planctomycetota bacterium]
MNESRVTSLQNQRVKDVVKLRDRRGREKQGRFIIDGRRELAAALAAGVSLLEAFVNPRFAEDPEAQRLLAELSQGGTSLTEVTPLVWEKLTFGDRGGGILAVATRAVASAATLSAPAQGPMVVLDRVQKPGNIGAVLRTADATAVSAVALADPQTDLFNPNVIRASLGTVFQVPVHVDSASNLVDRLRVLGVEVIVARVDAELTLFDVDLTGPCAVVFGNEAEGVSELWRSPSMTGVRLPMLGSADSLNVSTSAAAVLYEAVRQRHASGT